MRGLAFINPTKNINTMQKATNTMQKATTISQVISWKQSVSFIVLSHSLELDATAITKKWAESAVDLIQISFITRPEDVAYLSLTKD